MNTPTVQVLNDKEVLLVSYLVKGATWDMACMLAGVTDTPGGKGNAKTRLLRKLRVDDITQVRLWASAITNTELDRLCGRSYTGDNEEAMVAIAGGDE